MPNHVKRHYSENFVLEKVIKKYVHVSIQHINHIHLLIQTNVSVLNYHACQQTDIKYNNNND